MDANDADAVSASTKVVNNPHTGVRETRTEPAALNGNILQGNYFLRSFAKGGVERNQLVVTVMADGWLFLHSTHSQGESYPTLEISREVASCGSYGCSIFETVGISLTDEQIDALSQTGFVAQISGKRGKRVINIPAAYFAGYKEASKFPAQPS